MALPAAIRRSIEERARLEVATIDSLGIDTRLWTIQMAPYAAYLTKKALIEEIDRLRDLVGRAPTEVKLPAVGGLCDPFYVKGRTDLARLLNVEVATVFVRARLQGKDMHAAERMVLDAIASHARTTPDQTPTLPTVESPWDINPG